jgi:hypothetical protein
MDQIRADIRARHEAELAQAGPIGRFVIQWKMYLEFKRQRRRLGTSSHSLYCSRMLAHSSGRE